MDAALSRLYASHSYVNYNINGRTAGTCGRSRVLVHAATAPLTSQQRALLHTAIRRGRTGQEQQEDAHAGGSSDNHSNDQQLSEHDLQLRSDMLQLQQLVANGPAGSYTQSHGQHELSSQQLQQQQATEQVQHLRPASPQHSQQQVLLRKPAWNISLQDPTEQRQRRQQLRREKASKQLQQQQQGQNAAGSGKDAAASMAALQQQLALRQLLRQQQQRQRQLQLQLRSEPAVLTALIKRSTSWQQLQHLFTTYTAFFNPVHVSAAITHLAQLIGPVHPSAVSQQPQQLQQLLQELTSATAACVPDYGPRQLANTLWALNKLGLGSRVPRKVQASYLAEFRAKLQGAAPQHISSVALAVGGMGWGTSSEWQQSLLQDAASKQQYFKPQELANLLYALPQLETQPSPQWLSRFLNTCYNSLPDFNSQELSMLGLGLVRLKHRPSQHWLAGYVQAVQVHLDATGSTYSAVGSSSSSSVPEDTDISDSSSGGIDQGQAAAAEAAISRPAGFQPQGFVNVLRGLCAWGERPGPALRRSCLAAAGTLLPQLNAEGSSTLVWALAKLHMPPSRALLARLLAHSQLQLQAATATDLALFAWGLGTLGITPKPSTTRSSSSKQLGAIQSSSSISSSSSVSSRLLVPWLSEFMYSSHRALGSATARDVACLLVGVVRMRLQPGARWLQRATVEAHHRLPSMTPTELTNTLLCLARLNATPDAAFMATYCSCSSSLLNRTASVAGQVAGGRGVGAAAVAGRGLLQATGNSRTPGSRIAGTTSPGSTAAAAADLYCPQTLANTLGAMAMLRYQPPKVWSRAFLAASQQLLPVFTPRDFSFTIWALAQLEMQPQPQWLDLFLVQLRQHVPGMDSAQLSATIWALAKLGHRPGVDWMQRFLDRVVALSGSSQQQQQHSGSVATAASAAAGSAGHAAVVSGRRRQLASRHSPAAAAAAAAPPSELQLSADFSSIILHGLTMWAVARLDYQVPGSSRDGSSSSAVNREPTLAGSSSSSAHEGQLVLAGSVASSREAASSAGGSSSSGSGGGVGRAAAAVCDVQQEQAAADVANAAERSVDGGGSVATSRSRDGSIVFHF